MACVTTERACVSQAIPVWPASKSVSKTVLEMGLAHKGNVLVMSGTMVHRAATFARTTVLGTVCVTKTRKVAVSVSASLGILMIHAQLRRLVLETAMDTVRALLGSANVKTVGVDTSIMASRICAQCLGLAMTAPKSFA